MTWKLLSVAALAVAVSACAASAEPGTSQPAAPAVARAAPVALDCAVRATRTAAGLRLEAVIAGEREASGDYDFRIVRDGPAGASDVTQGGPFVVASGDEIVLAATELGRGRARTHAVLTVHDRAGMRCTDEYRS
jgi:hypothetical protein